MKSLISRINVELISIDRVCVGPKWSSGPNSNVDIRHTIHIAIGGEAEWEFRGTRTVLRPGKICLAPGRSKIIRFCQSRYNHIAIRVAVSGLGCRDFLYGIEDPVELMTIDLDELPEELVTGKIGLKEQWYMVNLIRTALAQGIPDLFDRVQAYLQPYQKFQPVLDTVQNNLSAKLQIQDLVKVQGMHRTAFSRAFKASFGVTPKAFLDQELNRLARDAVLASDSTMREIAEELEFSDEYYFNRFFKRMNGIPPQRFRLTT